MASSVRYFSATIMGGRLHVSGLVEWIPWDSSRLDWWPEDKLDLILAGGNYGQKVRTLEELESARSRRGRGRPHEARVEP